MLTLSDILRQGASRAPQAVAITHGNRSVTYAGLAGIGSRVTRMLGAAGIEAGERVALLWDNGIEYASAYFGISASGAVVVPLDTSLKPDQIVRLLNDCAASGLIVQAKYAAKLASLLNDVGSLRLIASDNDQLPESRTYQFARLEIASLIDSGPLPDTAGLSDAPPSAIDHDCLGDCSEELAAIFYTSGSTGTPKGVMLSHRNLISNTAATVKYLRLGQNDSILVILPFYYIYGNSLLLTHMAVGGRLVIDNRFAFPQAILATMARERVTGFAGVPSNYNWLLGKDGFTSEAAPSVRYLTQAGGAMGVTTVQRVAEAFPERDIYIMYGQTEASPRIAYCPPERLHDKPGSIGIPVPGVSIEVCDSDDQPVSAGHTGEIVVSGPNVMMGYWNQPDEEKQVLRDDRLFTGDVGYCDKDGFFHLVARKKEIIKVGGNRVSAREIEDVLDAHELVVEAAVVGVPDDLMGEAVKAVVVLRETEAASVGELRRYCQERLAGHKVPQHLVIVERIPKLQSGKIDKRSLVSLSD